LKKTKRLHIVLPLPATLIATFLQFPVPPIRVLTRSQFIEAGTTVGIAAPVIAHNEDIYGLDTDAFRPERWLEASDEQLKAMDRFSLTVCSSLSVSLSLSLYHRPAQHRRYPTLPIPHPSLCP
jgi:hypothetical protein